MKLTPRDELIVGVGVIVLIAVILAVVLVRPQFAELGKVQTQRQEQEAQIKNAQAELELLKAAKGEALQVQADLIKVGNQVPDAPQLPSVIVQIQDLANDSGITFVQISPQAMTAAGEYTTLPLQLQLQGQFFDVVDFMYRLQRLSREVRVVDFDLGQVQATGTGGGGSSAGGTSGQPSQEGLNLKVTANVFVMGTAPGAQTPQQSGAGGSPSPAPAK